MRKPLQSFSIVVFVFFLLTVFYPTVSADLFSNTQDVTIDLNAGFNFGSEDEILNLANQTEIETTWDMWLYDWNGTPPEGIFYGQYFKPSLIRLEYKFPEGANSVRLEYTEYFSFPRTVIMSGSWRFWVKSPIYAGETPSIIFTDLATNRTFGEYTYYKTDSHYYASFLAPIYPNHLYKFRASGYANKTNGIRIEASQDILYDSQSELLIREWYGSTNYELTKEYEFDGDWSFIFEKAIGHDGMFGMYVEPDENDKIKLRKSFNFSGTDIFVTVFLPFLSNNEVDIYVNLPQPNPDIPMITTKNGYFASTSVSATYSEGYELVIIEITTTEPIIFLCSATVPKDWDNELLYLNDIAIFFTVYIDIRASETVVGELINYGNNTNMKLFDYGYGKYVIFTDTKIYVYYNQQVKEFIIEHDLLNPDEEKEGFWQKLKNILGDFFVGLWDGIKAIAGYIWTGLMWIGKIIVEIANFIWGVLVEFWDKLTIWFGDLIHNLNILIYPMLFIIGPVIMMFVISYGSRMVYYEEE